MNCIIIDDKKSSSQTEEYINRCSSLRLTGVFDDLGTALDHLSEQKDTGLAFIDINHIGPGNLEIIKNLENAPNIIVITSNDKYALKAFELNVIDYIIEPLTYSRFYRAVDKTIRYFSGKQMSQSGEKEIFVRKDSNLVRLKMKDIILVEALENYISLITSDKKFVIHFTMKSIESQLPSDVFARVHRSYIINKSMIKSIQENSLDLIIGKMVKNVPIGKSFKESLISELNVLDKKPAGNQE